MKLTLKEQVLKRDDWTCVYCGYNGSKSAEAFLRGNFHVDHKIPRAKGGSEDIENMVTACGPCNTFKSDNEFDSIEDASLWLKIYREECHETYYETFVAGTASTWKQGGVQRTWDRYNKLKGETAQ